MHHFLAKYSAREQGIIVTVAALLLIFLAYTLVLAPLADYQKRAKFDHQNHREVLEYVMASGARAKQLQSMGAAWQNTSTSVVVLVERVLKQHSLATPKSLNPNGNQKASLSYDEVDFDRFMQAADTLASRYGVKLDEINARGKTAGNAAINAIFQRKL